MKKYELQGGTIWRGDCLEVMASLPDDSVQLVFGSPPYEDARLYLEDGKDMGISLNTKDWVKWMVQVYQESLRICNGLVAFVVGHGYTDSYSWSGGPALLIAALLRKGIILRSPKWYKRDGIPGSGGDDDMSKKIEWIVCATRGGKLPWSNNTACGHPPKRKPGGVLSHRTKDGRRVQEIVQTAGISKGDTVTRRTRRAVVEISNPGDVIDCGSVGGGHLGSWIAHENEAPFPEKLASFFIRSYCPPEGIVMDPFLGSGTTAASAIKYGRLFYGCDLRKSQIKLTIRRVAQAHKGKGLMLIS